MKELARRCGVPYTTLVELAKEQYEPKQETARRIEEYARKPRGWLTSEDLPGLPAAPPVDAGAQGQALPLAEQVRAAATLLGAIYLPGATAEEVLGLLSAESLSRLRSSRRQAGEERRHGDRRTAGGS